MSNQLVITSGAKVRSLNGVITGTTGVLDSLPINAANGIPQLDSSGKILVSQLPNSVMEYKGTWNAATNTPTLADGTGNQGDVYLCNVAGTVNFGSGPISFVVGDQVIYSGTIWQRASGATGTVTSVAVTESGDALSITGSPITTSGTINIGFAGTSAQYVAGNGSLITFPTIISSIGLTMPSAFTVSNSPLTANGTIAVTGAGYPSQYIRGDGTLADFPTSGGGGSSVSYYLNGGTSQGTIGGTTYYEMSRTAETGTGVDFAKSGNGLIVSFLTDANDPALLNIPGGNWNYEIYASMSSNGGTPELYAELYKYDGTTFTLISTSSNEILYDGTNLNLYTFAMAVPSTTLAITDRLAVKLYATNSGGKTTTIHTQNGHLCQIITTFSTGITALNGLTAQVQYFATGTSGTDFNISSATSTHTFNLPTASATNRGALSSADWTTFNNKQNALTNPVTGTSVTSRIAYFNGTSSITGSSNLNFDGTNLLIGNVTTGLAQLHVYNASAAATMLLQTNSTTDYSEIAVRNDSSTATSYFRQYSTATTGSDFGISRAGLALFFSNYATNFAIGTRNGGNLIFGTADTERMRITTAGNVGIGIATTRTVSGYTFLAINGSTKGGFTDYYYNGTLTGSVGAETNLSIVSQNANGIDFITPSSSYSTKMTITNGGNVGIGTSSPSYKTVIQTANNTVGLMVTTNANDTETGFYVTPDHTNGIVKLFASGNADKTFAFFTGNTERIRITSLGQLQIKQGADTYSYGYRMINSASNRWSFVNGGDNNLYYGYNEVDKGVFNNSTGAYTTLSDINKKKDFEDSIIGLNAILGLKPTLFRMKDEEGTEKHLGFIAQEVKEFIPQAYSENKNGDNIFIGLTEMPIIATLVKAVQELEARLKTIENK
jgi:hypothetical protein